MSLAGGVKAASAATAQTQQLLNQVKGQVEGKTNAKYTIFEAVEEATQVVSGINHFIKVKVGENDYIFVKIWEQSWTNTIQVTGVQTGKSATDSVGYF